MCAQIARGSDNALHQFDGVCGCYRVYGRSGHAPRAPRVIGVDSRDAAQVTLLRQDATAAHRGCWSLTLLAHCLLPLRLARKRDTDDGLMVVVVDGFHVCVSGALAWLWLGLPKMGSPLSEVHPKTSSSRNGLRNVQPPVLGLDRRLRVDGDDNRPGLGLRRDLVAMRT